MLITVASRSSSRLSSRRASRLGRLVASCRRLASPVRVVLSFRLSSRMGAVSSCCSLVFVRSSSFAFSPLPVDFISYVPRPVASRRPSCHVVSSCVSYCVSRLPCRPSCRSSCRPVLSSCSAPFCSAVRSFSLCLPWRSCRCVPVSSRFALASRFFLAARLVVASRPSSCCFISFSPVISFGLIRGRFMHVLMPVLRVRAVPFCLSLVSHSFHSSSFVRSGLSCSHLGRGAWRGVMAMMAAEVCSRPVSSERLVVPARYSLTRCGMATGGCGYGAPFHAAHRSSIASHILIVLPSHRALSLSCVLIPSINEARKARAGDCG